MSMTGINKATLVGKIEGNPFPVKYKDGGIKALLFWLNTPSSYKDPNDGHRTYKPMLHNIRIIGKLAEVLSNVLHDGEILFVEGKIYYPEDPEKEGGETLDRVYIIVDGDRGGRVQQIA